MSEQSLERWTNAIHHGDAAETLRSMPESSVHMAMTSPAYWGLRDYGVEGQLGHEGTLEEYIQNLVEVGRELKRVLRPDGSWWLNLGDSFAGSGGSGGQWTEKSHGTVHYGGERGESYNGPLNQSSYPRKSKLLIPHRVAIALQDAGWIVRHDVPWTKMGTPDPAADRLRTAHEFVFHLVPQPIYWHDETELDEWGVFDIPPAQDPAAHYAVFPEDLPKTPIRGTCPPEVCADCGTPLQRVTTEVEPWNRDRDTIEREQLLRALEKADQAGLTEEHLRACRSYGFSDAGYGRQQSGQGRNTQRVERLASQAKEVLGGYFREFVTAETVTTGREATCECDTSDTESGIVLDPFCGTGTTCRVAKRLGRRFVGIDLNAEYVSMAQARCGLTPNDPSALRDESEAGLEAFADGNTDGD